MQEQPKYVKQSELNQAIVARDYMMKTGKRIKLKNNILVI